MKCMNDKHKIKFLKHGGILIMSFESEKILKNLKSNIMESAEFANSSVGAGLFLNLSAR